MELGDTGVLCANSSISPLKPSELQVLRAQYEKEGEHVGVQTKFNFAWVSTGFIGFGIASLLDEVLTPAISGPDQIQHSP